MNLISTSLYTGIATLVRTISGFVLNKILAIYVGPSGLAFIGQFQSFVGMVLQFASGAINTGVVKYTSEFRSAEEEKKKIFSTALCIGVIASIPVAIILLIFAVDFSKFFFKTEAFANVFRVFSLTLLLYVLNNLLMSILNGQQEIKRYTLVNIVSSIIGLLLTSFLLYIWGLQGALFAMVTNQSIVFFVTLILVIKSSWFRISSFTMGCDKAYLKKFLRYASMALVSALVVPLSQIFLRDYAAYELGWEKVGYWEAMVRLSNAYLILITSTLSVYYLPKLSELKTSREIRREVLYGYKIIIPILLVFAISLFSLRDWVIVVLFSTDFLEMRELFVAQLLGDFIKICAWILANIMLAKAMSRLYIISEILFCSTLVILSIWFVRHFGLIGLVYAYSVNYFLYFIFNIFCFKNILLSK